MDLVIAVMVAIQATVIAVLIYKLRKNAIGQLGFLLMATTFAYHGLTEIVQYVLPGHNPYRYLVSDDSLRIWLALITGSMCSFTLVYWLTLRGYKWFRIPGRRQDHRLADMLWNLSGSYLLKWQVLFSLGLAGFVIVDLEKIQGTGYVSAGIADQFAALMFSICLATLCITVKKRWHLLLFLFFSTIIAVNGSRLQVLVTILTAMSVMTRYGRAASARTILGTGSILLIVAAAISVVRGDNGMFRNQEALTRLENFGSGTETTQGRRDRVVEDSVYRFDGNSYGAMVVDKQLNGYGITGLTQFLTTIRYTIPSFIYTEKLQLDTYLRNEETYQDQFYGFSDEVDYISDLWSLMIGYTGMVGFAVVAPCLGWIFAKIDNWLATSTSVTSFVCGISLSVIPLDLELGIAGIPYLLRGLAVLLIVAQIFRIPRVKKRTKSATPVSVKLAPAALME